MLTYILAFVAGWIGGPYITLFAKAWWNKAKVKKTTVRKPGDYGDDYE